MIFMTQYVYVAQYKYAFEMVSKLLFEECSGKQVYKVFNTYVEKIILIQTWVRSQKQVRHRRCKRLLHMLMRERDFIIEYMDEKPGRKYVLIVKHMEKLF